MNNNEEDQKPLLPDVVVKHLMRLALAEADKAERQRKKFADLPGWLKGRFDVSRLELAFRNRFSKIRCQTQWGHFRDSVVVRLVWEDSEWNDSDSATVKNPGWLRGRGSVRKALDYEVSVESLMTDDPDDLTPVRFLRISIGRELEEHYPDLYGKLVNQILVVPE